MFPTAWTTFFKRVIGRVGSLIHLPPPPQHVGVTRSQHPTLPSKDKQHYIPRFLFKGFACKYVSRKQVSVWYFEQNDTEGREENTRDIGYELDFYGAVLDDLITKKEDLYAKVIDRVRDKRKIQSGDKEQIVEFAFSLTIRTKQAREKIVSLIESSRNNLHTNFTDANSWTHDLKKKMNHQYLREQFEQYVRTKLGNISRAKMNRLWERNKKLLLSRVTQAADKFGNEQAKDWEFFFSVVRWDKLAEDVGEKGQAAALINLHQNAGLQPSDSLRLWQNFHWKVEAYPSGSLILGDVPVLQINKDSSVVSVLFGGGQRTMIVLPIRHDLLLVASEDPNTKPPILDALNRASAELSLRFFVSSQNRPECEGMYHGLVGRMAPRRETEPTTKRN